MISRNLYKKVALTHPFGRFPKARMNCNRIKPRYRYSRTVLRIGVAVFPNGNALPPLETPGVPTSDMITLVVSQKEAVMVVSNRHYL